MQHMSRGSDFAHEYFVCVPCLSAAGASDSAAEGHGRGEKPTQGGHSQDGRTAGRAAETAAAGLSSEGKGGRCPSSSFTVIS